MVLKLGTLQKVDQKYLESFEMWCWRRMEMISWTDCVRNLVVLCRLKKERIILHTIKRSKANWIGHILHENYLLQHIIKGKIEGTGRRGRRRKKPLDNLKEKRTLYIERGSTRSHSAVNLLWKKLWACRKTGYRMNE
jgi:hypothetical protein